MPLSRNINNYADVAAVLNQVLAAGETTATYRLPTQGKAVSWMQRAYMYRKLFQEQAKAQAGVARYQPPTPYDSMQLSRIGDSVKIDFAPAPLGELVLPGCRVIKPEHAVVKHEEPEAEADRRAPSPVILKPALAPKPEALAEAAARLIEELGGQD